ncbi:MAG: lipid-A-disaccharide synthase [Candidatus Riflebacteria bacterium]|nr:lipid-A-disaccharide synthase [Candidatus Riflebacteria bacterium]
MIVAGEYSGSLYGSVLARRIAELSPGIRLTGIGGHHMEEAGVELLFDSSTWGGIGLVEALKRSPLLLWIFVRLKRFIRSSRPDVIILIDYPGFNMRVVRFARSLGIPTLYYFPPGKYRCAPEDVRDAALTITRVAAPFQIAFDRYQAHNARVELVGHPLLDVISNDTDVQTTRRELGVGPDEQVVGLLPGSRLAELELHTPLLCRAATLLREQDRTLRFFMPLVTYRNASLTTTVQSLVNREIAASRAPITVLKEEAHKVMAASRLILVSSGTATLEAAYFGTPMVIVYRVSRLTALFAPLFHSIPFKFVGLPNILADRPIVPELIQDQFTAENVATAAREILTDRARHDRIRSELLALIPLMGEKGASDRVARMALEMIS